MNPAEPWLITVAVSFISFVLGGAFRKWLYPLPSQDETVGSIFGPRDKIATERHKELMETFGKLLAAVNAKNDILDTVERRFSGVDGAIDGLMMSLGHNFAGIHEHFEQAVEKQPSPATVVEGGWQLISSNCMCAVLDGAVRPCKRHYEQFNRWLLSPQNEAEEKPLTRKKVPVSVPALPKKGRRNR